MASDELWQLISYQTLTNFNINKNRSFRDSKSKRQFETLTNRIPPTLGRLLNFIRLNTILETKKWKKKHSHNDKKYFCRIISGTRCICTRSRRHACIVCSQYIIADSVVFIARACIKCNFFLSNILCWPWLSVYMNE